MLARRCGRTDGADQSKIITKFGYNQGDRSAYGHPEPSNENNLRLELAVIGCIAPHVPGTKNFELHRLVRAKVYHRIGRDELETVEENGNSVRQICRVVPSATCVKAQRQLCFHVPDEADIAGKTHRHVACGEKHDRPTGDVQKSRGPLHRVAGGWGQYDDTCMSG